MADPGNTEGMAAAVADAAAAAHPVVATAAATVAAYCLHLAE